MNQKQINTANEFVETMLKAEGKFTNIKKELDDKKTSSKQIIDAFNKEQKSIICKTKKTIKSDKSSAIFKDYERVLANAVNQQTEQFNQLITGTKFINDFESTFIVSVFGKVKSGKSYLGNYIMGNAYNKNKIKTNYEKLGNIDVVVYDKGRISKSKTLSENNDESEGMGFGVASTEATSTIQYFRIGGLTWFDTPGIGSITKENEELAEEYIKNSDLVIFTMNSDAAGTQQELAELAALYKMGKPMLIMVTQSDEYDQDIDDNGNMIQIPIPKSEKDRQDVEAYLINEINEKGMSKAIELSGGRILTISTKLAIIALTDNSGFDYYEASNIEPFIRRLIEITNSKSLELKEKNPRDRFNKFIDELKETLNAIENEIKEINIKASSVIKKAENIKKSVVGNVKRRALSIIHNNILDASTELSESGQNVSGDLIAENIIDQVNAVIKEECNRSFLELVPDISAKLNNNIINRGSLSVSDLSSQKLEQEYEVEVVELVRKPRKAFGQITNLIFGEKYEKKTKKDKQRIEIDLGDNSYEIEKEFMDYFENVCYITLEKMIADITEGCVRPLKEIYDGTYTLIKTTENELEGLKIK